MSVTTSSNNNNMQNAISTATGLSYGSGFAGFISGLSLNEWLSVLGAVFMILTYFTNLYFRTREDKRKQLEHALKTKLGELKE